MNLKDLRHGFPLKGFSLPLTPRGRSSASEAPPWHYGGDALQIVYEADEGEVKKLIPPPLEPGPNPRLAFAWFAEFTSVSSVNPELPFLNPERTQYREFLASVSCQYKDVQGFFASYVWVDNDFTLLRGWIQGFPKKLGRIYMTKMHELNPQLGGIRVGSKLKGILESHGEKLATGTLEVNRNAEPSELPRLKLFLMRHFPNIENPSKPSIHEICESIVENIKFGKVWAGKATLKMEKSEIEELDGLSPLKILNGYYFSFGFTITGGRTLHKYV